MKDDIVMKEHPLVVFTLLTQLSVGAFWILCIVNRWASGRVGSEVAAELTSGGFLSIIPLMLLALLFSFLHLGTPLNAWRATANLRTSWLSREIIFVLSFTVLEAVFAWLNSSGVGMDWLRLLVGLGAALLGFLALYSMTRLYMLRTITSWNTWMTPTTFVISTLLLGGLGAGIGLTLNPTARGELLRLPLIWISLLALLLLSTQMVLITLSRVPNSSTPPILLLVLRVSLLAFALIVSTLLLFQSMVFEFSGRSGVISWLTLLSFIAILAEQAVGRYLFYLSFERVGI